MVSHRHFVFSAGSLMSGVSHLGRFRTDLPFEKLWVNSQKMVKNWYFFVFFRKNRALFAIFCAKFVFLTQMRPKPTTLRQIVMAVPELVEEQISPKSTQMRQIEMTVPGAFRSANAMRIYHFAQTDTPEN